ncbi:unnamed protein product [Rotaria sordida]|uniref:Uncharacterized protein n=1 Tax=Rotaria sordida TaxID=392033 RepID=A0A815I2U9_9BILA|nr:unnamed protein product [Rotaria sordida]CAF1413502.1 unnamed protein product [Rotaria sordida]CAF1605379.1 unnamed protein product [Rotaria sordida]CAF4100820.1 unnamed protein product [Rotaria sordida]
MFFDLHTLRNSLKNLVKFYSWVTQNYLPASNLDAIRERLDNLIRNYITAHEKLDQTKMDKRVFERNDVF